MNESHPAEHASQPPAKAPMSTQPPQEDGLIKGTGKAYLTGAAKEAGKQTTDYEHQHASQQLDDVKAQAQGMWQKYCGCLGSS